MTQPIKLTDVEVDGFSASNAYAGESVSVLTRAAVTSDNPEFYAYMEAVGGLVSVRAAAAGRVVLLDHAASLLLVIHSDGTAELYLNDIPMMAQMLAKRDVVAGEAVTLSKIADVIAVRLPELNLKPDDKVLFCFKVGWKFGLFFDLGRDRNFDVAAMEASLAHLYRILLFQDAYETVSDNDLFDEIVSAGWFPFIEVIGGDFEELLRAHRSGFDVDGRREALVSKFTGDRIEEIAKRWWARASLIRRQAILQPALNAYKAGDYVACIKILLTEIEGIIRDAHIVDAGKSASIKELLQYAIGQGVKKARGEATLFFPKQFLEYMQRHTFAQFDPVRQTGVPSSRHGVSHGGATAAAYTQERALQAILTVDQIGFYL